MLTRIRNAQAVKKADVTLPYSKFKHNLADVLVKEGWIKSVEVKDSGVLKSLVIQLKYTPAGDPFISVIKRISKPGQRIYTKNTEIPRALGGMGSTIVSTSKGLMTDKLARTQKMGGEVICQIW